MFSIKSKIDAKLAARRNGESGLALLDVLLGMAIFALIAVIAVQAMGSFRERAYVSQVTSDAKQVGTGIEAALTAPNSTFATVFAATVETAGPAGVTIAPADLTAFGVNLTGSNAAKVIGNDSATYQVCVSGNGKFAIYDAAKGAITGTPGTGNCP